MLRTMLPKFLLITALLLTQLGGLMHGISHIMDERGTNSSVPHDKHCELCGAYSQLGNAVGITAIHVTTIAATQAYASTELVSFHTLSFTAYTARAPPYSA